MNKKGHIHAVTMLEMLIVLAVSSIVFASAAKCYEIVFQQTTLVKHVLDQVEEAHRLHYILERDAFHAKTIYAPQERELAFNTDSSSTTYAFGEDVVLRKMPQHTDTFRIKTSELAVSPVANVTFDETQMPLLAHVRFIATVLGKEETFIFRKNYSTETLLNLSAEK